MTDFTITIIDPDVLAAISWARVRDNANPGRSPGAQITTDQAWVQIEAGALFSALAPQKASSDITDGVAAARAGDPTQLQAVATAIAAKAGK